MKRIYQAISIDRELPPVGKYVTTIDKDGEHRVYRMNDDKTWSMRDLDGSDSPNNNLPILYWLKEGIDWDTCINISVNISGIELLKAKQYRLFELKGQIKEILAGHVEIPDDDVFDAFRTIEKLSKNLDNNIRNIQDNLLNGIL